MSAVCAVQPLPSVHGVHRDLLPSQVSVLWMNVAMSTGNMLSRGEQLPALPGMLEESSQRRSRTRRKRKALLLGQMCFMGCLMLVGSSLSYWAGKAGEFFKFIRSK